MTEKILENATVVDFETPFDQKPEDVLAFFEDKYGDVVRVVDIGGYSKELCAGTHTKTTGEIGFLKVVQESAIAAGSRRIEAVAGASFANYFNEISSAALDSANALKCQPSELNVRVKDLIEERKQLQKQLAELRMGAASKGADSLAKEAKEKDGVKWVVGKLDVANPNELRGMGVRILKELGEGVVVLGAELGEKVSVVCLCSPEAIAAGLKAGEILSDIAAKLGGKGGGKPDFAMGGAKNDGNLQSVLDSVA